MYQLILSIAIAAVLVSCGGRKPKLTEGQRNQFTSTLESAGRAQRSANALKSSSNTPHTSLVEMVRHQMQTNRAFDPIESEMSTKLKTCDSTFYNNMSDAGSMGTTDPFDQPMKFGFELKGANCPVDFTFLTTKSASVMTMKLAYEVRDAEFKKLNDVYAMTLEGSVKGAETSGGFSGKMLSQKFDEIPIEINFSGSNDSAEITMNWTFPTYTVEMKAVLNNGKVQYYENDAHVSENEFKETLKKGGDAFSQLTLSSNS